jgi:flagellar hook-basal body complex protein FliE
MPDPLGLIGPLSPPPLPHGAGRAAVGHDPTQPSFRETLERQIDQVNRLQRDAKEAIEDLAAGRRDDLESVMIATQKADTAFRMLLQVRNKVMDAFEEVKQIRV